VVVKVQVLLLPAASRAVEVTGVEPSGKAEPEGGTLVVVTRPQQTAAITVQATGKELAPAGALVEKLAGQAMLGGCVSRTVTVKAQVATPALLLAVQVTTFVPMGKS